MSARRSVSRGRSRGVGVGGDALGRAPARVQDGRVVAAAEGAADGRQGAGGVLAGEVHRDLAGPGDAGGAAGREELVAARRRRPRR